MTLEQFSKDLHATFDELKTRLESPEFAEWHFNLWDDSADTGEWYQFAQAFGYPHSFGDFDKAWQFRTLLHGDYDEAKIEFINLVLGWY